MMRPARRVAGELPKMAADPLWRGKADGRRMDKTESGGSSICLGFGVKDSGFRV